MSKEQQHITSIGGQAVMEGVMMRGPFKTAVAVRKPDGEITTKVDENGTKTHAKIFKLPVLRGCVNFVDSLVIGMKALMYSAEFVDLEDEDGEEQSKFDKWLEDKLGDKLKDVVIYFAVFLSVIFSVGLFILLPSVLSGAIEAIPALEPITSTKAFTSVFEGVTRMLIFLGYMALVSQMKDIKRVFEYHGAEHKTIACYEAGEPLTVENIRKYSRFHPRCGTSFLILTLLVSIAVFSVIPWTGTALRVVYKLLFLPMVMGISYELLKLCGRTDNLLTHIIRAPGLWVQRLTVFEPDDSMIECAIQAVTPVLPENPEEGQW